MLPVVVLLIEFAVLAVFKVSGTTDVGNPTAFILVLVHTFILLGWFNQNKKLRKYSKYLAVALLFRLVLLLIDVLAYPSFVLPNGHGDEDIFYRNAIQYAETGYTFRGFYCEVMGTLFRFVGYNRLFGQYVSMLCSIVALVYLAYILSNLDISDICRKRVFQIVCILPNFAILSSMFMREAVITMFLTISFFYFNRWATEKRESYYFLAAGLVLPAALFHSGAIAVLVGYVVVRLIYDNKKETIRISFANILYSVIFAFIAIYIINHSGGDLTTKFNSVDSLEDIANTNTAGGSSYAQYVGNSNNPLHFILYTPLRLFFFLFSPLPWLWRGLADIIAFLFSSMYYFVIICTVFKRLRIKEEKKRPLILAFFVIALATTFVFAWGVSNSGTATRHRDKMVTLFAILWALSLDGRPQHIKKRGRPRAQIA